MVLDIGRKKSLKIGIFGGTFDPIHLGHLIVAEEARVLLDLDQVIFIPAGRPWFKSRQQVTDVKHRLAMVECATASNPHFSVSKIETTRSGPTYTVETLEELRERYFPEDRLFLIIGVDSLREVDRWQHPEQLFEMATLVGVARPGHEEFDPASLESIAPGASDKVVMLDGPLVEISATDLRHRVATGVSIRYRVPEPVEAYIREHGLYLSEHG